MGMNTRGGGASNKTYLGVYSNELVLEYSKKEDLESKLESLGYDTDKIQERKKSKGKNEGQSVYYFVVWDVEGLITNIKVNENDWGDFVEIELTDVDEKFVISLGDVFSRTAKDFIRRIGNLDLTDYVNFGLWNMTADETGTSSRSGVKMYQDDEKIEYFLTYEDMPAPTQTKKGRKVEWNYDEQEAFIYEYLLEYLEENFPNDGDGSGKTPLDTAKEKEEPTKEKKPAANAKKGPRKPRGKRQPVASGADAKGVGPEEDDDLPF